VGYGYSTTGAPASLTYPTGLTLTLSPNALGQPTLLAGATQTFASAISYFPNGALKQFTYGNGIVHTLAQNARGLPDRSRDADGATSVHDDSYAYDQAGNVLAISDGVAGNRGDRDMAYDGLNRLTSATSPMFGTATYAYDVQDNLTHVQVTGGSQIRDQDYCYDASNRLTNIKTGGCSAGGTVVGLGYDVQGNLANKNGTLYAFDYGNRLRSGGPETYRYDAYGRRARSINSTGGIVYSLYGQAGQLLWQRDQRTNQRRNYIYLQGSLLAEHRRPIGSTTETIVYQHTDALGSPVATTNSAKTVLQRSEYEPYGYQLTPALADGPGYTGHVTDAATGLVYMQQRYYDPLCGCFVSNDPVPAMKGPFNRYWYASDNPFAFKDPDGRADVPAWLQQVLETSVPGQATWNHAVESFGQGRYGLAAAQAGVAFVEAGVAIATLGGSHVETTTARALTNVAEAGSIRAVNAVKGATNCVSCAIATDATLAGRPASALGGGPAPIAALEKTFGTAFGARTSVEGIAKTMTDAGSGARGIVFGSHGQGEVGHVFNVVNQNGTVRFLDGQTGRAADTAGYEGFRLLRTNP
jgi:RHS repeat-associated protein